MTAPWYDPQGIERAQRAAGVFGSGGLPSLDTSVGYGGGFGIDTNTNGAGGGTLTWNEAYPLTADSVTTAIDNSYMSWDPNNLPNAFTIKQAGWYRIAAIEVLGITLTAPYVVSMSGGTMTEDFVMPQGSAGHCYHTWVDWFNANTQVSITDKLYDTSSNATNPILHMTYAALFVIPMFNLS